MPEPVHLFSYGTLRLPEVQMAVFGRLLGETPDALPGFEIATLRITDPTVVALSGSDQHLILRRSADGGGMVEGSALEITEADLPAADDYEVDDYVRTAVTLRSGRQAFVYIGRD